MTRRHKLCQRHLYNDRKQRALPSIRKTPTNYADCPYQLRRNGTENQKPDCGEFFYASSSKLSQAQREQAVELFEQGAMALERSLILSSHTLR
ncbi:hypothetical protein JCM12107_06980 [Corynebacterium simulans]